MLAYSSVAQAGYIMGGVVVSTSSPPQRSSTSPSPADEPRGLRRDHRPRARDPYGDDIERRRRPWAASAHGSRGPLTIAMLSLAGIPATAGSYRQDSILIQALVDAATPGRRVIVVGSMISLGYYLRVIAAVWMRDAPAPIVATARTPPGARRGLTEPMPQNVTRGHPRRALRSPRQRSSSASFPSRCSTSCSTRRVAHRDPLNVLASASPRLRRA